MAFVLQDLWNALVGVVDTIASFFSSLWGTISSIANTGQGIFSGLVSYGSAIWQGIEDLATNIYNAMVAFANAVYDSFTAVATALWNSFNAIGTAISSAFYVIGNWIWSAASLVGQALMLLWNVFVGTIEAIFNALWAGLLAWFGDIAGAANSWLSSLVQSWRNKLKLTLVADMTLYFGWQGIQTGINNFKELASSQDMGKSLLVDIGMMVGSPIAAALGGACLGEILDLLIPNTDLTVNIFPTIQPTTPTFTLPRMTQPTGLATPASTIGVGVSPSPLPQVGSESVVAVIGTPMTEVGQESVTAEAQAIPSEVGSESVSA